MHQNRREHLPPIKVSILIIDDDELYRMSLVKLCENIREPSNEILEYSSIEDCFRIIEDRRIDVLLLDKHLRSSNGKTIDSIPYIPKILNQQPNIQILLVTSDTDSRSLATAIKLGAFGFVTKRESNELLLSQIEKAVEVSKLTFTNIAAGTELAPEVSLGAKSKQMKRVLELAHAFSQGKRPVLIQGETGTGKTRLAKYIHQRYCSTSHFSDLPFIAVNLSALPNSLVERELFGNEKGAFTDAKERKRGFFELANGGTLFLDEIGEISPEIQVKLLNVIEEKVFFRLGGDQAIKSNFKLICATHRDLEQLVKQGRFREDLYMRISTLQIYIPSLSERREDIIPIIKAALPNWAMESEVRIDFEDLPPELLFFLEEQPFRGNVRGIEQQLSRIFALAKREIGGKLDLSEWRDAIAFDRLPFSENSSNTQPLSLQAILDHGLNINVSTFLGIDLVMEQIESVIYKSVLKNCKTNKDLANILKTSQASVSNKLKRFGLKAPKD